MTVIDADGHVTETQEQVARYLDEPYRRRPTGMLFYPWDGWDRRMLGTLGEFARSRLRHHKAATVTVIAALVILGRAHAGN